MNCAKLVVSEGISSQLDSIALPLSVVNIADDCVGCLELYMKIQVLNLHLVAMDFGALVPSEHEGELSIKQLAHQGDLNIGRLPWQVEELAGGV